MTVPLVQPNPLLGQYAGNFRLLKLLGEGGMGAVYLGENQVFALRAAVKVLNAEMSRMPEICERFINEGRACAALNHPAIVKILDGGRLPTGQTYVAMEFLDGRDLEAVSRAEGQLELLRALRLVAQAASGLHAAHALGIVHRDVKPANLFVVAGGVTGEQVKVLDFGIAKLTDASMGGGVHTQTSAVFGSPGYMAPEQAKGAAGVDRRADVFSLAAVFYRLVTGQQPFPADTFTGYVAVMHQGPPPDPRTMRRDLPARLAEALLRGLSIDPDRRQPSMRHFILDLAEGIRGGRQEVERVAADLVHDVAPVTAPSGPTVPGTPGPGSLVAGALATGPHPAGRRRSWVPVAGLGAVAAAAIAVITVVVASSGEAASPKSSSPVAAVIPDAASSGEAALAAIDAAPQSPPDAGVPDAVPPDAAVAVDTAEETTQPEKPAVDRRRRRPRTQPRPVDESQMQEVNLGGSK